MHRRLNVTLPEGTVRLIDRAARKGGRSRLIDRAVRHYLHRVKRDALRKALKEGATRRAERDLNLAGDWFTLEEEGWAQIRK